MPTVSRHGPWRFFFYSNEGSEPPHVHVECADGTAKFWLNPVTLVRSNRLGAAELREIGRFIGEHRAVFQEAWNGYFPR